MNIHGLPAFCINKDISEGVIFTLQQKLGKQRVMIQFNEWEFVPQLGITRHLKAKKTIDKQDQLVINFDEIEVTYQTVDLNQLTLTYCCFVHKSIDSEFQSVIMPIVQGYSKVLRCNSSIQLLHRRRTSFFYTENLIY